MYHFQSFYQQSYDYNVIVTPSKVIKYFFSFTVEPRFQVFCLKIVAIKGCQKRGKKTRVKIQILDNFEVLYLVIESELILFIQETLSLPQELQTPKMPSHLVKNVAVRGHKKSKKFKCMELVKFLLSIVTDSLLLCYCYTLGVIHKL